MVQPTYPCSLLNPHILASIRINQLFFSFKKNSSQYLCPLPITLSGSSDRGSTTKSATAVMRLSCNGIQLTMQFMHDQVCQDLNQVHIYIHLVKKLVSPCFSMFLSVILASSTVSPPKAPRPKKPLFVPARRECGSAARGRPLRCQ